MKKPRITLNYLKDWINSQWEKDELPYRVTEIYRTNFTQDQYEGGAARLVILFNSTEIKYGSWLPNKSFYCFDTISYLNKQVKDGYELFLKYDEGRYLSNTILTVHKEASI